jgi:hypothetical protein
VPESGIHDFRRLEAGFPIRIASGMTVSGIGGRLTLISFLLHEFSDKANFGSPYTFDPANNISQSHHPASPSFRQTKLSTSPDRKRFSYADVIRNSKFSNRNLLS